MSAGPFRGADAGPMRRAGTGALPTRSELEAYIAINGDCAAYLMNYLHDAAFRLTVTRTPGYTPEDEDVRNSPVIDGQDCGPDPRSWKMIAPR